MNAVQKKRHHYVPKSYLRAFCDGDGRIRVYRKDDPGSVLHLDPDNIAHQRYYYSQPLPDGGADNNALEDAFSRVEDLWPPIVQALQRREDVNPRLQDLFEFLTLQRVRVPACRDAIEAQLAAVVKAELARLNEAGELPPPPRAVEGMLDKIAVTIDPHQSIHAIAHLLPGIAELLDRLGFAAIHNATGRPFLTSDNPVIWFNPEVNDAVLRPYDVHPDGPVMLLFPISPQVLVMGTLEYREIFASQGLLYGDVSDDAWVERVNRFVCRFAYSMVFANQCGQEELIADYVHESPVLKTDSLPTVGGGRFVLSQMVFGPRPPKRKWEPRANAAKS